MGKGTCREYYDLEPVVTNQGIRLVRILCITESMSLEHILTTSKTFIVANNKRDHEYEIVNDEYRPSDGYD